ncbi:regulatory protein, putative [plant metagenome]|uniref:Regulatory protein, putative n=1 Tax=plant metagenome TaxID=1297885 RepID=A0A484RME2_9ZZZZ
MPLYEYGCPACGVFEAFLPMARCREDVACPQCATASPRVASAPALGVLSGALRAAHAANERSAHAPRSTRSGHGMGCVCCRTSPKSGKTRQTADGGKAFLNARPWMISH